VAVVLLAVWQRLAQPLDGPLDKWHPAQARALQLCPDQPVVQHARMQSSSDVRRQWHVSYWSW
jgi:hypothetical protein